MSHIKEQALQLLGSANLAPSIVAAACGVSDSYISQLLADEEFTKELAALRHAALVENSERDKKADSIEDIYLGKLKTLAPFVTKPMEAARIYQIVNAAKRRGVLGADTSAPISEVVQLQIPKTVINNFTLNVNNQVISAGDQTLVTMQSGELSRKFANSSEVIKNDSPKPVDPVLQKILDKF